MYNFINHISTTQFPNIQSIQNNIWDFSCPLDTDQIQTLSNKHNIPPPIIQTIIQRVGNENNLIRFCNKSLHTLKSPYIIPNMKKSVDRILYALSNNQHICICGDNDVDGITGTAMLVYFFHYLGGNASYIIPSRTPSGFMFSDKEINKIADSSSLLITVDFGISAKEEIRIIKQLDIDVIITDHHIPSNIHDIPDAYAIINPQIYNDPNLASEKMLTGAGIAFKVIQAVYMELNSTLNYNLSYDLLQNLMDFATLGTVADTGTLLEDNRIIANVGMKLLRGNSIHKGLNKLIAKSKQTIHDLHAIDILNKVSAKINSLGRISDAHNGVKLLLSKDSSSIANLINVIEATNATRQHVERTMWDETICFLSVNKNFINEPCIIIDLVKGHPGVSSIISSRLMKLYNKTAFVITPTNEQLIRVSVRSLPAIPIMPLLQNLSSLFITFGGHNMAAGITLHTANKQLFKQKVLEEMQKMHKAHPHHIIHIDAFVSIADSKTSLATYIEDLGPFGHGNQLPIFCTYARITHITYDSKTKKTVLSLIENNNLFQGAYIIDNQSANQTPLASIKLEDRLYLIAYTPCIPHYTDNDLISIKDIADYQHHLLTDKDSAAIFYH